MVAQEVPHLMCVKLLDFPSKICQVSTQLSQSIAETIIRFEKERWHFAHPLSVKSNSYIGPGYHLMCVNLILFS